MELATRWQRLRAALTDAFLGAAGYFTADSESLPMPARLAALVAVLGLVCYQVYLLTVRGQTIGKRLLGIRVVRKDTGENGGFKTNVLLRGLVNGVLNFVPVYFFADSLMIFRENRRCLHDYIAGTIVVTDAAADSSTE